MQVSTIDEIRTNINGISGNILYLFDIDNTIITNHTHFDYNIDKLKLIREYHNDKEYINQLLSKWRKVRTIRLTDSKWPEFLASIDRPYALTKMDVGSLGEIVSMEQWRNNELLNLNIKFNPICPIDDLIYHQPIKIGVENATFFNGIFYTGYGSKGSIINHILSRHRYDIVVFIDDRVEQLDDVKKSVEEAKVKYIPMQFIVNKDYNTKPSLAEQEIEDKIMLFLKKNQL
jgi:hypothetical protein